MKEYPRIGDMVVVSEAYLDTESFKERFGSLGEFTEEFIEAMIRNPMRVTGITEWECENGEPDRMCNVTDGDHHYYVPIEYVEPAESGDGKAEHVHDEDMELMETIRETAKACGMTTEEYIRKLYMPVTAGKTQETKPEEISLHYAFDRNLDHAVLFFVENGYKVHLEERDYASIFSDRRLVIERRD